MAIHGVRTYPMNFSPLQRHVNMEVYTCDVMTCTVDRLRPRYTWSSGLVGKGEGGSSRGGM